MSVGGLGALVASNTLKLKNHLKKNNGVAPKGVAGLEIFDNKTVNVKKVEVYVVRTTRVAVEAVPKWNGHAFAW